MVINLGFQNFQLFQAIYFEIFALNLVFNFVLKRRKNRLCWPKVYSGLILHVGILLGNVEVCVEMFGSLKQMVNKLAPF